MAVIVIKNLEEKTLEVQDFSKTLLQHLHGNGIDWMFTCGAKGRCTTCKVIVLEGIENLEPKTNVEQRYEGQGLLNENERLTCQARIRGSVTIRVLKKYKIPHMNNSS